MEEALGALRQSVRRRVRVVIGIVVLFSLFMGAVWPLTLRETGTWWVWTALYSVAVAGVCGAYMWFFHARSDLQSLRGTGGVDHLVPAEAVEVGPGKRLTVRQSNGEDLVWRTRRASRVRVGQAVWLVPPVDTQQLIVAVAVRDDGGETDVLWPKEVSRTPGRWDW